MRFSHQELINKAYRLFNERNTDEIVGLLHPKVYWQNVWEGGYIEGNKEVIAYWQRQWKEMSPMVYPVAFKERKNKDVEVIVHQVVTGNDGNIFSDLVVKHIYSFDQGLISAFIVERT